MEATIEIPPKLIPVFLGDARYRGAYGGRGSAKTRTFAKMAAVRGYQLEQAGETGVILCAREYMNSLDESSFAEVKSAILSEPWLADHYDCGDKYIRTKGKNISFAFAGLWRNLDSIKSKSKIHLCWVDEAEPVTEQAWVKLIPTVREEGSELWVTWNPERKTSATHKRFRLDPPSNSKIVEINYTENPWFPAVLEQERRDDFEKRPEQYQHIWEGDFVTVVEGAYFARHLLAAKEHKRITKVPLDPLQRIYAFWDLGGRGKKSDATVIIIAQFIGREIRVLDHYKAVGQPLSAHVAWLRRRGYENAFCVLPHDGAPVNPVADASWETALEEAGFEVDVVPNQGAGAAIERIEAGRARFSQIWFNDDTTEALREALGWYHEKIDEKLNIGLGPLHDWSSHDADSFGLMCTYYEEPSTSDDGFADYETDWVV